MTGQFSQEKPPTNYFMANDQSKEQWQNWSLKAEVSNGPFGV